MYVTVRVRPKERVYVTWPDVPLDGALDACQTQPQRSSISLLPAYFQVDTLMTRRRNKSRGADLEAQPSDEGVYCNLSCFLSSLFLPKRSGGEMRMK